MLVFIAWVFFSTILLFFFCSLRQHQPLARWIFQKNSGKKRALSSAYLMLEPSNEFLEWAILLQRIFHNYVQPDNELNEEVGRVIEKRQVKWMNESIDAFLWTIINIPQIHTKSIIFIWHIAIANCILFIFGIRVICTVDGRWAMSPNTTQFIMCTDWTISH